jgi:uncharacterized cupredoxin-like copper-binding protein
VRSTLAAVCLTLPALLLAGCADDKYTGTVKDGVRVVEIHIGWNDDLKSQYMRPDVITVKEGDKVRFVVTNDDDPAKDYNGDKPLKDNFHDVALLDYDGHDYEHEVPAGTTTTTRTDAGNDYFVASRAGTFRIICEVGTTPSHDALGMHAQFIVE